MIFQQITFPYHIDPDDPIQPVITKIPGGMGDHPFGESIKIQGLFNVTGPDYYKVEYSANPADPASWTPIMTPKPD